MSGALYLMLKRMNGCGCQQFPNGYNCDNCAKHREDKQ